MGIYSYLCGLEKGMSVFAEDVTWRERLAVWLLRTVYAGRYWKDIAIAQSKYRKTPHKIREVV